jgi:hypothetical protein
MSEKRKNSRYQALACARIPEVLEGEGIVRDISVTGCRVEYTAIADIPLNTQYELQVIPEKSSKVDLFELQVESKWVRNDGYSTEVGFLIVASPTGKHFQRYVDYLACHHKSHL